MDQLVFSRSEGPRLEPESAVCQVSTITTTTTTRMTMACFCISFESLAALMKWIAKSPKPYQTVQRTLALVSGALFKGSGEPVSFVFSHFLFLKQCLGLLGYCAPSLEYREHFGLTWAAIQRWQSLRLFLEQRPDDKGGGGAKTIVTHTHIIPNLTLVISVRLGWDPVDTWMAAFNTLETSLKSSSKWFLVLVSLKGGLKYGPMRRITTLDVKTYPRWQIGHFSKRNLKRSSIN